MDEKERKQKEDELTSEIIEVLRRRGIEVVEFIDIPILDEKYSKEGYYPDIIVEGTLRIKKKI